MGTEAVPLCPTYAWPDEADKVLATLQQGQGVVIYRLLPHGIPRNEARGAIRLALRQTLATWLGCPADTVTLSTEAGSALRVQHPKTTAHLSISHEDGLSVAAIHPHRAIGVDVLATSNPPWVQECQALARDYLGPEVAAQLATWPTGQHATHFATAWTRWEAGLKSCGQGLEEWTPALQSRLDHCDTAWLELPDGYCGAVALHPGHTP